MCENFSIAVAERIQLLGGYPYMTSTDIRGREGCVKKYLKFSDLQCRFDGQG